MAKDANVIAISGEANRHGSSENTNRTGLIGSRPELPNNREAERQLLGAILINNDAYYRVADCIKASDFFDPAHRFLFEVIGEFVAANRLASPITLKSRLEGKETASLTFEDLTVLVCQATTIYHAPDFARQIRELSVRRELYAIAEETAAASLDAAHPDSPSEQIEAVERRLYSLAEPDSIGTGFQEFESALAASVTMAANAYKRSGKLSGISSGFVDLDRKLGGLQNSDLIIVAGRPGMGKTALATNMAFHAAKAWRGEKQPDGRITTVDGAAVGFFSLEMSAEQLATRIIAEQVGIASSDLRRGMIDERQFQEITDATRAMRDLPFHIDQTGGLHIAQLATRARRLKRQKGLDLLFVDYLQLLSGSGRRASDSRVQEVTEITTGLKALAKELNIPIVALSQLSRQVEARDDKRPLLSDLRESGSIEQDADVVMFVYREEYYVQNAKPRESDEKFLEWQSAMDAVHGRAEVIISKQRHGPTGSVDLAFESEYTRFSNLAQEDRLGTTATA